MEEKEIYTMYMEIQRKITKLETHLEYLRKSSDIITGAFKRELNIHRWLIGIVLAGLISSSIFIFK